MKIKLLLTTIILYSFSCFAQINEENYYYYKGEKKKINICKERIVIYYDENKDFEQSIESIYNVSRKIKTSKFLSTSVGLELKIDSNKYNETYNSLKSNQKIKSIELVIGDSIPVITSNVFYVKLKNNADSLLLLKMAKKTKTEVLRKVQFADKWYALETNKQSTSNALSVSNIFFETGYFDKVDPGFIFDFSNTCVSDTRYSEQWAINNYGIDINACNAWSLTKGNSSITIAIIDQGIDNNHTEFTGVNFTQSYDAKNRTSPAQIYGDHGTHVCGIISSNHNQANIAGVAPGIGIMEISHPLSLISTISEDLAAGINWAVQNGAHILSNSWGDQGGAYYNDLHSSLLEEAIDNALDNGRGGFGSIVVFASGNSSSAIDYPAYYRPEILVIGSITLSGQRSSFSGYGNQLDIVAPGSAILSTTRNNNYASWDGTSMATPHASAVAGLLLSKNNNLTRIEVVNIIESTAQKIGNYSYQNTDNRTNGTWNNQMGYGLLDAYAAILAVPSPCTGTTNLTNQTISTPTTISGCNINVQNVTIINNSSLILDAQDATNINGTFEVQLGSTLEIK